MTRMDDDHQVHGRADIMTTATVESMFDHDTPDRVRWGQVNNDPSDDLGRASPGSNGLGGPL